MTPKIRAEIQVAPSRISDRELARLSTFGDSTIRRWRYRDDIHDRPRTLHNLLAILTTEQEAMLIAVRTFLCFGLHRRLRRREVPTLAELARQDAGGDEKPRH